MAGGWTKDGAVQDQIDASVNEAGDLAVVHSRFHHHDAGRVRLIRGRAPDF